MRDREAWHSAVHGVAKSQTRLSDGTTMTKNIESDTILFTKKKKKKKFTVRKHIGRCQGLRGGGWEGGMGLRV